MKKAHLFTFFIKTRVIAEREDEAVDKAKG